MDTSMASAAARERYARKNEQDELERAFRTIDKKGDDKIDADELHQLFLALGHKPKRGEVEDMIWEVDEDCDGCLSWLEFQACVVSVRPFARAAHMCLPHALAPSLSQLFLHKAHANVQCKTANVCLHSSAMRMESHAFYQLPNMHNLPLPAEFVHAWA